MTPFHKFLWHRGEEGCGALCPPLVPAMCFCRVLTWGGVGTWIPFPMTAEQVTCVYIDLYFTIGPTIALYCTPQSTNRSCYAIYSPIASSCTESPRNITLVYRRTHHVFCLLSSYLINWCTIYICTVCAECMINHLIDWLCCFKLSNPTCSCQ